MKFLDDLIVKIATTTIRGVFAVGTALVYVQFVGLVLLAAAVASVTALALLPSLRTLILGG